VPRPRILKFATTENLNKFSKNVLIFKELRMLYDVSEEDFCKKADIPMDLLKCFEIIKYDKEKTVDEKKMREPLRIYRKTLGLGPVPIFTFENEGFRRHLQNWINMINDLVIEEAKEIRNEMSHFFEEMYPELYWEADLWDKHFLNEWVTYYRLFSAKLLLCESKADEAAQC